MERPLIAVIGEGNVEEEEPKYKLAYELGLALIDNGYRIITGRYGGIMEAASRAGRSSGKPPREVTAHETTASPTIHNFLFV